MVELRLMVHVVFAGHLVNNRWRRRVLDDQTRLRIRVRGPDTAQQTTAAIADRNAGILRLRCAVAAPKSARWPLAWCAVRSSARRTCCSTTGCATWSASTTLRRASCSCLRPESAAKSAAKGLPDPAMPRSKIHIVQHGVRPGHPHNARGARRNVACVNADAADDRITALRTLHQRDRLALARESRIVLWIGDHRRRRIEPDQNAIGAQMDRLENFIAARREVQHAMAIDGRL